MSTERIVALVGQRDEPTDGVADYCAWLGGALGACDFELATFRVRWPELSWSSALAELREKAEQWRGCWVLLQYTAMAWSRHGFPGRVPGIVSALKKSGVRCGVVFHDYHPFPGNRIIDRVRRAYQLHILWRLYQLADVAIFTAPLDKVSWAPAHDQKSAFIPVGANCPEPVAFSPHSEGLKTVAVYCVTAGRRMVQEVSDIGYAVKSTESVAGALKLVVFGRGSQEAASALKAEFAGTAIDVEVLGLLSPEDVSRTLVRADVLLFVRGEISTRRGSAIAGIACGLPIVGFQSVDTAWPLTEAGLLLVPEGDREALSIALTKVISDPALRQSLQQRSRHAQEHYFSWLAIAQRLAGVLHGPGASLGNSALVETGAVVPKI
jgi:glycosyltransferase involved in cell wall biosynthesis